MNIPCHICISKDTEAICYNGSEVVWCSCVKVVVYDKRTQEYKEVYDFAK